MPVSPHAHERPRQHSEQRAFLFRFRIFFEMGSSVPPSDMGVGGTHSAPGPPAGSVCRLRVPFVVVSVSGSALSVSRSSTSLPHLLPLLLPPARHRRGGRSGDMHSPPAPPAPNPPVLLAVAVRVRAGDRAPTVASRRRERAVGSRVRHTALVLTFEYGRGSETTCARRSVRAGRLGRRRLGCCMHQRQCRRSRRHRHGLPEGRTVINRAGPPRRLDSRQRGATIRRTDERT